MLFFFVKMFFIKESEEDLFDVRKRLTRVMYARWEAKDELFPDEVISLTTSLQVFGQRPEKVSESKWVMGSLEDGYLVYTPSPKYEPNRTISLPVSECNMKIIKTKSGTWRSVNCIKLSHAYKALFKDQKYCFVYFRTGHELQRWYFAINQLRRNINGVIEHPYLHLFRDLRNTIQIGTSSNPVTGVWFNYFINRAFCEYHNDTNFLFHIQKKIQKSLDKITNRPSFVKGIILDQVVFGPNFPLFTNIRLVRFTDCGEFEIHADADYSGGFELIIEIQIEIDLKFIDLRRITSKMTLKLERLKGKFCAKYNGAPSDNFWISFLEEPGIEIVANTQFNSDTSSYGSLDAWNDILVSQIKKLLLSRLIMPNMEDIPLPIIGNEKKNRNYYLLEEWAPDKKPFDEMNESSDSENELSVSPLEKFFRPPKDKKKKHRESNRENEENQTREKEGIVDKFLNTEVGSSILGFFEKRKKH
eukprot:TRINITY_DN689_c0_g1_i1.p1 TRINITY_DN689_c0_g1~~TRINITY_DN689_c0_g1_i1.p1  ORF type:complete len:473 (+),score=93.49 TRINITY_DN689_c0_g1_i1:788-2206(+)